MNVTEITRRVGAKKTRKRVGRGNGSGSGKTCGRGHKGLGQRSGATRRGLAEGGMFPLFRRLPKVGFNNAQFRKEFQIVNLGDLEARFDDGEHVTAASLEEAGLIRDREDRVKILGEGELKKKLTVDAHRFSASAATKIEALGGTVQWLTPKPKKKFVRRPPAPKAEDGGKAKKKGGKASGKEQAAGKKGKGREKKAKE